MVRHSYFRLALKCLYIVPARLESSRLPYKILRKIGGYTLLEHVIKNIRQANITNFLVACDSIEVQDLCNKLEVQSVMTDPTLPSGTDRVAVAFNEIGGDYDAVVNLQGDLALFDVSKVIPAIKLLKNSNYDITTIGVKITNDKLIHSESTVKMAIAFTDNNSGKVLYFSRSAIPFGAKQFYQHLGVYVFRKHSIERFTKLQVGYLEACEKLEQLRALEKNMTIGVSIVKNFATQEINTEADVVALERYFRLSR